jgi:hypothetical protein
MRSGSVRRQISPTNRSGHLQVAQHAPSGDQGRKIIPRLNVNTATTKTTISAGTILKTFIAGPYRRAKIVSVQY